jgi:hypothetical protein
MTIGDDMHRHVDRSLTGSLDVQRERIDVGVVVEQGAGP